MEKAADLLSSVLGRLLGDQQTAEGTLFRGQFARDRDPVARSAVERDDEPLEQKPQFYMTFNAVQMLQNLTCLPERFSSSDPRASAIQERLPDIRSALEMAGDFAERMLLRHSRPGPFIAMRHTISFKENRCFVSYRHTVGAAIVLNLLGRNAQLQRQVVHSLLSNDIQRADGGWPICDDRNDPSDLLCSAHAALLLWMCRDSGDNSHAAEQLGCSLWRTLAYLTLQSARSGGWWVYEHDLGALPFTARTYPEVAPMLSAYASPYAVSIPRRLASAYPIPADHPYQPANAHKTGVRSRAQVMVRLACAFRAAHVCGSQEFAELHLKTLTEALESYSPMDYYETYDLCALLAMLLDDVTESKMERLASGLRVLEPLVGAVPIIGSPIAIARDVIRRAKEEGFWPPGLPGGRR